MICQTPEYKLTHHLWYAARITKTAQCFWCFVNCLNFRMDGAEGAVIRKWRSYAFESLHCIRSRKTKRTAENTTVSNATVASSGIYWYNVDIITRKGFSWTPFHLPVWFYPIILQNNAVFFLRAIQKFGETELNW